MSQKFKDFLKSNYVVIFCFVILFCLSFHYSKKYEPIPLQVSRIDGEEYAIPGGLGGYDYQGSPLIFSKKTLSTKVVDYRTDYLIIDLVFWYLIAHLLVFMSKYKPLEK